MGCDQENAAARRCEERSGEHSPSILELALLYPGKGIQTACDMEEAKCRLREGSCLSVAQSCLTLGDPTDCSTPGFPVLHRGLLKFMSIESVMPSNHLILCRPLLLLSSVFPSIRVFSNESALPIRWPEYWIFSFSISPSNEYSGLISFRMDWLDLLAVQGRERPDKINPEEPWPIDGSEAIEEA